MKEFRCYYILFSLFNFLFFFVGCKSGVAVKFDESFRLPSASLVETSFSGLSVITNKTDSSLTLYWLLHKDAANYLIYDVTSEIPVLIETVLNPTINNFSFTNLIPDHIYKFRVRMKDGNGKIDNNVKDLMIVMNHSPDIPQTPILHTPASSPGTVNRPTFNVGGVKKGDLVKIYSDDLCTSEVSSGVVTTNQTNINLQVANGLSENIHFFYANATNAHGFSSNCTKLALTYILSFSFDGLTSISNITDSTATLNWSIHPKALSYTLYDTSSGTPVYKQSFSDPNTASVNLKGLIPDKTYKFRLKMLHSEDVADTNTNDLTIVMNHAPFDPLVPTYHTPASSPDRNTKPTFTVGGVKAGDVVKLYENNNCNSSEVASGMVGIDQTSINLRLAQLLLHSGNYSFSSDVTNSSGYKSNCVSELTYELLIPTCPDGYIIVPPNNTLGVNQEFCIAKYEMKCIGPACKPSSQPEGKPMMLSASSAWDACIALNTEELSLSDKVSDANQDGTFALISNKEAMTVARSIEEEPSNWVDGTLSRGWSSAFGNLPADNYTLTGPAPLTDLTCLYSTSSNLSPNNCSSTGAHIYKRTHKLQTEEEIWDYAGNVAEWTDWAFDGYGFKNSPASCAYRAQELNAASCQNLPTDSYMPADESTSSSQNIGQMYGGFGLATLRGGGWRSGSMAGIYGLDFQYYPHNSDFDIGFRCVFRPKI